MYTTSIARHLAVAGLLMAALAGGVSAAPQQDSFTYQGRLEANGQGANDNYTFVLRLFDADIGGLQIGTDLVYVGIPVNDGLFSFVAQFAPGSFDGNERYIEVEVKEDTAAAYTLLSPRQTVTTVPYAAHALNGGGGASQWTADPSGIHYLAGNVAIGQTSDANPDLRFVVNAGAANANPAWIKNDNPSYAALAVQNDATNGIGFYDAWSDRHYIAGRLGIGTLSPVTPLHVQTATDYAAVFGEYTGGLPTGSAGVYGVNNAFDLAASGVQGLSTFGAGVRGHAVGGYGVQGSTDNPSFSGGYFFHTAGGPALIAAGLAKVNTLQIVGGADLVEGFATGDEDCKPGTVVVIDETRPGNLRASTESYDPKVAGVVSGAGGIVPGIRLGQEGMLEGETLVAMTGRVYVKCSTENGPIRAGDRLTTSGTSGHAMRATDRDLASGAVIGKAMSSLEEGAGLVLVLVDLQ